MLFLMVLTMLLSKEATEAVILGWSDALIEGGFHGSFSEV